MTGNGKWRYAASLIIAAREGYHYPSTRTIGWLPLKETPVIGKLSQRARLKPLYPHVIQQQHGHVRGVDVLFVQRTTEAGFMPDSHVFPGGVLDPADSSSEWLRLFPTETMMSLVQNTKSIPVELAFRICAIRETFEETGILLAKPLKQTKTATAHYRSSQSLVEQWRDKVCDDANHFIELFREIKCVPDVWSLIEWSNWFTPENIPRRYDTMFYLCCLGSRLSPIINPSEVTKAEWLRVDEALCDQHITLPPPQVAELSIINMFPSLQHLHLYSLYKSIYDNDKKRTYLPRRILFSFTSEEDSVIYSPLPGDDLYPVETSLNRYECSSEALRHLVTLTSSHNLLYEFTATVSNRSQLVTNKMLRMLFEGSWKASYVNTIQEEEIKSIIDDINDDIETLCNTTSKL